MSAALQNLSTEWVDVRAGRPRVVKGHLPHARLNRLREIFSSQPCPALTSFWITRDRRIHFKPNFPAELRQPVREIMIP